MSSWQGPSELDRSEAQRGDPAWVQGEWKRADARVQVVDDGRLAVDGDGNLQATAPSGTYDPETHFLLGIVDRAPIFATEGCIKGPTASLRQLLAQADPAAQEVAATAVGLINWHRHGRFCPTDGGTTRVTRGGFVRVCSVCGREIFPRTDPAVIVAVIDHRDRLLLAHQATWDAPRVSVLAGFVEVGESFERAVHREIAEEVGVEVKDLQYFGSQPWPFPQSVMVGFHARAASEQIVVDGVEIDRARWYDRADLNRAVADGSIILPGASSIASRLIGHWRQPGA